MLHKDVLDCKVKVCALEFGRSTFSTNYGNGFRILYMLF